VHYDNPAATVFAYVRRNDRFLALRRAHEPEFGGWDLPGGFIESGETPEDSIRRETVEETGLEIAIVDVIGAYSGQYGPGGKWTVDVGFLCDVIGGTFALSPEKSEAAWVTLAEFPRPAFAGERSALAELRRDAAARARGGEIAAIQQRPAAARYDQQREVGPADS
jgi:ADP-ribose pyrophosphatase YjhB (NUDIX family)